MKNNLVGKIVVEKITNQKWIVMEQFDINGNNNLRCVPDKSDFFSNDNNAALFTSEPKMLTISDILYIDEMS